MCVTRSRVKKICYIYYLNLNWLNSTTCKTTEEILFLPCVCTGRSIEIFFCSHPTKSLIKMDETAEDFVYISTILNQRARSMHSVRGVLLLLSNEQAPANETRAFCLQTPDNVKNLNQSEYCRKYFCFLDNSSCR